jgi:hypothetical protein
VARSFLTAINLNKNELQNAAVQNLGTAPAAPVKGQLYFDSTGNVMYWWSGTAWVAAMDAGGSGFPGYAPGGSTVAETTFGLAKADGVATTVARADHTHGSPVHDNAAHNLITLSALGVPISALSMASQKITGLADPSAATDAANKQYVDNLVAGLSWKNPVSAATTANITLSGIQTIDGLGGVVGYRILVKNQTLLDQNGIYVMASGAWTRATDADTGAEMLGAAVFVSEGTTQGDTSWVCTTNGPISVGASSLVFVQFAGGGTVTAGAGLTQSGNTLNVVAGDATLTVAADSIVRAPLTGDVTTAINAATIAANVVDNTKLADMPLMTIKANNTGLAADPSDITVLQFQTMTAGMIPRIRIGVSAAATQTVVNHNLNSKNLLVNVYRTATPFDSVECDIERTDNNNVTVRFAVAPAASEYTIVVMG